MSIWYKKRLNPYLSTSTGWMNTYHPPQLSLDVHSYLPTLPDWANYLPIQQTTHLLSRITMLSGVSVYLLTYLWMWISTNPPVHRHRGEIPTFMPIYWRDVKTYISTNTRVVNPMYTPLEWKWTSSNILPYLPWCGGGALIHDHSS